MPVGHRIFVNEAARPVSFQKENSVFLGNLPRSVTEQAVVDFFEQNGITDVTTVRLVRDKWTQEGKGFGFAMFGSMGSVREALDLADEKLGGRQVRITRCRSQKGERTREPRFNPRDDRHKKAAPEEEDDGLTVQRVCLTVDSGRLWYFFFVFLSTLWI